MTLHIIGIGLNNEKDITLKGLELVQKADFIYLESYTSKLNCSNHDLAKFYNKQIILAHREMAEGDNNEIIQNAKDHEVAFLVVGDPFSATTHLDLMQRAKEQGIKVTITNNASILNAVGITGLQLYKFGKTTSIPYPEENFHPETSYDVIKMNQSVGLHTLLLLDIKPDRFMSVNEAIKILLDIEEKRKENIFTKETLCIGCARLGSDNPTIKSGKAEHILNNDFGEPLHCLIVPGKMHFMEEEAVK
ncbi:diphthine synthase [Candidatus Woesearchaeota archaeon CG10_big_fil_rev_8_21_14_0_10_34_8]|nr:MAG: diphthine synthase [Candidatus Woesearchaeota archaeon CG10_big_fil_rev_8_21_14_0_10_34_8]